MIEYDSEELQLAYSKFDKCKYRSTVPKIKKSCCSSKNLEAFACFKRKIFPLSPKIHCLECNYFSDNKN